MTVFDSIANVNDYLSEHWLAEVFPGKLKELANAWRERAGKGKATPVRGLATLNGTYLNDLAALPEVDHQDYVDAVTQAHQNLLSAVGFEIAPTVLETSQAETPVHVPLLGRFASATSTDALHILQAVPVDSVDAVLADDSELLSPITLSLTSEKTETMTSVPKAMTQLFVSDDPPRYLLVVAGAVVLVTDAARWSEGRYLGFDVATALDRRDDKATGELASHAGLWSADVLLPNDDGKTTLDNFTEDSEKHAVGVSEDLREGLRISIEKIANEVLQQRRAGGQPVEGIPELPRDLTTQSLRFLYRILFLLFAEARPELGILPTGAPEYSSGYGLDRLREIIQVPLTGPSTDGHHLHDSLNLLFRLVNDGHNTGATDGDGLVFEAMRSDLFDRKSTPLIDEAKISNRVLQQVLTLLLMSKPSKNKNKQRGYISYAQLGINQLGAVYEGLMSYSGLIADDDMVEVAKDGNADKGSWLVPSTKSGDYDEKDLVWREDRLSGRKDIVRHAKGNFVFRLSGRDRQRSASYYTPEILTKTVVKHALAELITKDTQAHEILEYRICEPALGSGAFLNEAINQLAAEYLNRRQDELGERIDPEAYTTELQKVKAYIALHRAYGVDLNSTAVELAEVSLWLNVMHRGMQAPWFGLHLRRGNSLIGARRATYDFTALGRAKKSWLKTPPIDRPLTQGVIGDGEVHHFLLPADGWGAVADAKQAKELAPEQAAALKKWRSDICRKPSSRQTHRLRALAQRVERLWELALRRLEISECEIARQVDVWGSDLERIATAVPREAVESELFDPEGPYMRLRLAMDAWCALSYWPLLDSSVHVVPSQIVPPDLDDWIATLEGLLGAAGIKAGLPNQGMLHEAVENFEQLSKLDDLERQFSGMLPLPQLLSDHQWLGVLRDIGERMGFIHWELDFAQILNRGGFDLQVGNPPWVRPTWQDDLALAEHDPFFRLQENIPVDAYGQRRDKVLSLAAGRSGYLQDLVSSFGSVSHLGSPVLHPLLSGLKVNLYTNFMEHVWRNATTTGIVGLLHPENHFSDPAAGRLRSASYQRLRRHWQFINELQLFSEVHHQTSFGIHIYGSSTEPSFVQAVYLLDPRTLEGSLDSARANADAPGIQYPWGGWDLRPSSARITNIDRSVLESWAELLDPPGTPSLEARLLRPLGKQHLEILSIAARVKNKLADVGYRATICFDEAKAKKDGLIEWDTRVPVDWDEVILQGPHISVANPFAKQPNENCRNNTDYSAWNLGSLASSVIPRTNYQRSASRRDYDSALPRWDDVIATQPWRVAWRRMTQPGSERSFQAALIPPGAAHVNTVVSLAAWGSEELVVERQRVGRSDPLKTALLAGLFASLPFDYLVKVSGKSDIWAEAIDRFPAPIDHPASNYLLHRVLKLNCVSEEFKPLWGLLFNECFTEDGWTSPFGHLGNLAGSTAIWDPSVAVRTEAARRAALVEIDALAAIMLGLSSPHLVSMYRAQFGVLRKYEYSMFFDMNGRRITKDHQASGVEQQKDDFKLLEAYLSGGDPGDLLSRYAAFPPDDSHAEPWFYKPDREAEMCAAYADFEQRLASA